MKFVCDSCKAQYMISDEKVGPAGVKVRCKKCSHVIHVKKEEAAAPPPHVEEPGIGESTQVMQNPMAGAAPDEGQGGLEDELGAAFEGMVAKKEPAPEPPPGGDDDGDFDRMSTRVFSLQDVQKLAAETGDTFDLGGRAEAAAAPSSPVGTVESPIEWYVAIDDAQVGPLTFDQLKGKWDGAAIGPDTLTWRPGLADWRPLSQIAELASKLAPRPAPAARESTVAAIVPAAGAIAALTAPPTGAAREPLPWERAPSAAAAPSAAPEPPPVDDDVDWKPSAASALASLVEAEMAAAKAPKKIEEPVREKRPAAPKAAAGPAREEPLPPPVETTGIRNLLEDLPEPPPQENSRIIPLPKDAVPGAMPEARPRVERSTLAFERHEKKAGSPVKWIALGGVALLFVVGGVIGVLFATGVIKPGGTPPTVVADAAGANVPPPTDAKAGAPKEPVAAKAGEPEKAPEPAKVAEPEKAPEAGKPGEEPAKVAEPAKLPDAGAAGASAAKEPEKAPVRVADARGGRNAGGRSFGAPAAAAAAKPEPEPEPEPVKKSGGGKSSIDDLFETEFGGSGSSKAPAKKGGGVGTYIPPAPGAGSSKPKSLGQGDIMGVVVSHKGDIKGCAGKYKASGGGTGTLVMAWTINPNGKTSGVRPKGGDHAPLAACIGGLIKGWKFPEYEGATMAPIEFPFNF